MEKDIDQIIEVDPGEAQALIELVEMLFEEWYGASHRRQARLQHIASIADAKRQAKNGTAGKTGVIATELPAAETTEGVIQPTATDESLSPVLQGTRDDASGANA